MNRRCRRRAATLCASKAMMMGLLWTRVRPVQREQVTLGQVEHVQVVSYAGAVAAGSRSDLESEMRQG